LGEYSAALETTGAALNSLIQGETVAQITAFPWPIQCTLGAIAGVSASLNPKRWPGKTHWMWIIRYRHGVVRVRFKVTKTKRNESFYENAIRKRFWKTHLKRAGVRYRGPNQCRYTFIRQPRSMGMVPLH